MERPMPATMHMMGPEQFQSAEQRSRVMDCFAQTLAAIEEIHPIDRMDIVLFPTSNHVDPDNFIGGMCHNTHAVECSFNPDHPKFESEYRTNLPALLIHEVHHALRYRYAGPWTVGENLVLEGLAMAAEKQFGYGLPNYGEPLPKKALKKYCEMGFRDRHNPINPAADPKTYSWIWQQHGDKYTANMYHAGYRIISNALDDLALTPFAAIALPYEAFFSDQCRAKSLS
jgi:hypothetical protein